MKKSLFVLSLFALLHSSVIRDACAQMPGDTLQMGRRQRILRMKEEFILNRVPFADKEKENFLKILREFEQRRTGLMRQMRENRHLLAPNSKSLTSEEINRLLDQRMNLERLMTEEKERYLKSLRQLFPPERVVEILRAEREFMRSMFHKIKDFPHDRDEAGPPPSSRPPHHRPTR